MNKKVKFALLYVLLPLLCVAAAIVAGLNVPVASLLDLNFFSGLEFRDGQHHFDEWAFDGEMALAESDTLTDPGNTLRLVLTAPDDAHGRVVMLNDEDDEVGSADFSLVQGTRDITLPLEPGTVSFQIYVSDEGVGFSKLFMVHKGTVNIGFALLVALLPLSILALYSFRRKIKDKPEYGFLIVGIVVMVLFFALLPQAGTYVWDEAIHFARTQRVASIGNGAPLSEGLTGVSFTDIGYLPGALGLGLAGLFTEDMDIQYLFIRGFNSLTYLLACFFAVKCAKKYKMIFAIAALIPTSLFLGNSCNYDLMVTGFTYLSMSLMLSQLLTPKEKMRSRDVLLILLSFLLACLPKAVYVPFILLMLFLPKEKFNSSKQRAAFNVSIVLIFLLVAATFVLPALLSSETLGDARGGDVDPGTQMSIILGNPLGYASLLIQFMYNQLFSWVHTMSGSYAYFGAGSSTMLFLLTMLLVYAGLTDSHEMDGRVGVLSLFNKFVLFVLVMLTASLICTSMFISFTELGTTTIAGVQARYFLPLVPAVLILLKPRNLVLNNKSQTFNATLFSAALILNLSLMLHLLIFK